MTLNALFLCLLVSSAFASPVQIHSSHITLPLAIRINNTGGSKALLERDRVRFRALYAHGQAKAKGDLKKMADFPVPVTNLGQIYTANVGVGAGNYTLIVDTGSSNTWVGAGAAYQPGPNSQDTGQTVSVSYGSGNFSGEEFTDDVTLGSATISGQSIGVALTSAGLNGEQPTTSRLDGILGLGPDGLTINTTSGGGVIPTVTDNLASQGLISQPLVGISFVPTTSTSPQVNGQLDFGTPDNSKFTGNITFVPITSTSPASNFWGINQSISYSTDGATILSLTAGIVDAGTTLTLIATDAFQAYQQVTGATVDQATGLLTVSDPTTLQSLYFDINGTLFELTPNAQAWPSILNTQIGGNASATYLIIADSGSPSGNGLDFVNGFTFLQRFYSVYDTGNSQVGFATTPHTSDTTN